MKHGFIKVATASPRVFVADTEKNANELIRVARDADALGVRVLVFPELAITGYTCGDLFYSETLLSGARKALQDYLLATKELSLLSVVGLPLAAEGKLYNCAAVISGGRLLGIVPKVSLPSYGEFCETRYFASGVSAPSTLSWEDDTVPFGTDLLFSCREMSSLTLAAEICEDGLLACPPSVMHTAAGATLICNPAASNELVGKQRMRREKITAHAERTLCGYLFACAGEGESTTDLVFCGHSLICENGTLLAERIPFRNSPELLVTEIDLERLLYERRRMNTFESEGVDDYRTIAFSLPVEETALTRTVDPHPFLPQSVADKWERLDTILSIQAYGLKQRIERAYAKKLVIGISGGLDSTLALLVAARAIDALNRPRTDILAVTMPCFGTTARTKSNATVLCEELGVDFRCVDIFDAVNLHFRDIGHDPAVRDVTYENSQARERTQILMDIANGCGGMVLGTGDLSELALGWATYNGDHMSMYGVNADIPKTLVRHLVAHCADEAEKAGNVRLAEALRDVLNTPVSPELLPAEENGEIAQKTEDLVGPYELHDFYLYYLIRYGFSPKKLYRLAQNAHFDGNYDDETLLKWLKTLLRRFFTQQFKRSCLPDGPKVGSVGLSPRGDWRMPSDAAAALWLAELEEI